MLKHITLLVLLATLLAGCGSSTDGDKSATSEQTPPAKADLTFLSKMGVDVANIATLSGKVDCNDSTVLTSLTDEQVRALFQPVHHFDLLPPEEGVEGVYSIVGAQALPNQHTLLLFHIEFGDGATHPMAIYDHNGTMTDYLDLGVWRSVMPDQSGEFAPDHGRAFHELAFVEFDPQKPEFTLKRDYALSDWVDEDGEMKFTDIHWELLKDYHYSIDDNGHFAQLDTAIDKKGDVDASDALLDEISDLHYLPATDTTRLDKLLALMQLPDTKKLVDDPEGTAKYRLQGVMQAAFEQNGQIVLQWLAKNRGCNDMIDLLKQLFASGWLRKELMTQELAKMPQGDARNWLEQLTAQWGPDGAMG